MKYCPLTFIYSLQHDEIFAKDIALEKANITELSIALHCLVEYGHNKRQPVSLVH